MNTFVVNFYGGPGSGKSTLAAATFAELKKRGVACELVFEYVKTWAWEQRTPSKYDELYIFGQQVRRETLLYGKVDVVLTDRPLRLSGFYARHFGNTALGVAMDFACSALEEARTADGHRAINIFVARSTPYNALGRYQTEGEAMQMDRDQRRLISPQYTAEKHDHVDVATLIEKLRRAA